MKFKKFDNLIRDNINKVLNSCFNVYCMQMELNGLKPLTADEFGKAVDNDLKICLLSKKLPNE